MVKSSSWLLRLLVLPSLAALLVLAPAVASADTTYNISGTFGDSSTYYTGALNGGSFTGTFDATLPITSGGEAITTFNIELINSSDVVLADLTNSTGGGADVAVVNSACSTDAPTAGSCDLFTFTDGSDADFLELSAALDFTGGAVYTYPFGTGTANGSFAGYGGNSLSTDSVVTSGSIASAVTPEPSSVLLLGTGLLAFLGFGLARRHQGRLRQPSACATLPRAQVA